MLIVLDDVFNAPIAQAIADDYIVHKKSSDIIWCDSSYHEKIKPKTNRAIIFSSNLEHMVEPFTGTRLSVSINPWNKKPKAHI